MITYFKGTRDCFYQFEGARDISTIKGSFADKTQELMKFINGEEGRKYIYFKESREHVFPLLPYAYLRRDDKPDRLMLQKPKRRER